MKHQEYTLLWGLHIPWDSFFLMVTCIDQKLNNTKEHAEEKIELKKKKSHHSKEKPHHKEQNTNNKGAENLKGS